MYGILVFGKLGGLSDFGEHFIILLKPFKYSYSADKKKYFFKITTKRLHNKK